MENKGQEVILRKIPIAILLNALQEIWESGVDYIDIVGKNGVEQDTIGLKFREDYIMNMDEKENEEDDASTPSPLSESDIEEKIKNIKLSDEDLEDLV